MKRLAEAQASLAKTEEDLEGAKDKRSKTEQKKYDAEALRVRTEALIQQSVAELGSPTDTMTKRLESMRAEALGEYQLTVESCDNREQELRAWL
jgi:hypothetical protein